MAKAGLGKKSNPVGECALCLQTAELQDSHIIPAFAFRWLRSSYVTGYIRHSQKPNLRVQDGIKVPLLCARCELLLSKDENAFSSQLFHPILSECGAVPYKDWLLRFAVSLSWRVLKYCHGLNSEAIYTDNQLMLMAQADETWRDFLLNRRAHPGKFEQHLLIFTAQAGQFSGDLPNNINRYLLRGLEMDIVGTDTSLMTFAKMGPFALFGLIQKPEGRWQNTKIHVKDGRVAAGRFQAPPSFADFFIERAKGNSDVLNEGMSATQRQKAQDELNNAIMRDPAAFISTHHGKAMMADARLFGEKAILQKPD
jgi:hypothetical protein